MKVTEAEKARLVAGLSLEEAATRARVGPRYLRRVETRGGAGYALAQRLSDLYGCRIDVFLMKGGDGTPRNAPAGRNCRRSRGQLDNAGRETRRTN